MFCTVDSTLLINGSFNWTSSAVMGNNENVVVTNNPDIVDKFVAEFDRLWQQDNNNRNNINNNQSGGDN
jgi:cardiolipin hydrolase